MALFQSLCFQEASLIANADEVSILQEFFAEQIKVMSQQTSQKAACSSVQALFDVPDGNGTKDTKLNTVFGQLASYENPDFVGMDKSLNALKGSVSSFDLATSLKGSIAFRHHRNLLTKVKLWNKALAGAGGVPTNPKGCKEALANMAVVMSIARHPKANRTFPYSNIFAKSQMVDRILF